MRGYSTISGNLYSCCSCTKTKPKSCKLTLYCANYCLFIQHLNSMKGFFKYEDNVARIKVITCLIGNLNYVSCSVQVFFFEL